MSTTQTKLNRLIETKNNIRQKIISLGVDVPIDTPFKDYPSFIEQLGGIEFIETTTDQDLLRLLDLYKWLGTAEYEDRTYTEQEIQAIHDLLDKINEGPIEESKPDVPVTEPYMIVLNVGRTTYYPGDRFSLDGYIIRVVYPDGAIVDVSEQCTFSPATKLTQEDVSVEINCEVEGLTFSYTQPIYVVKQLDYVESTGSQYIDSNILSTNISRIDMSFTPLANTTSWESICYIEKNASPWSGLGLRLNTTKQFAFGCGTNSTTLTDVTPVIGERYDVEWHCLTGELLFNGINYEIPVVNAPFSGDLYLFSANTLASGTDGSPSMYSKIRLHAFKIYDKNGNLVRDYLPCRDKQDVVCLRNLVDNTYVYMKGSGSFVAGPEVQVKEDE